MPNGQPAKPDSRRLRVGGAWYTLVEAYDDWTDVYPDSEATALGRVRFDATSGRVVHALDRSRSTMRAVMALEAVGEAAFLTGGAS